MTLQAVTPEELDAWLQTTEVTEEDEGADFEPLPIDAPANQDQPPKQKKGSWRRRSSLDEENISSKPCFGVDAKALLANINPEETGGNDTRHTSAYNYLKRASDGSSTVVASNHYSQSSGRSSEILTFKKRRGSTPVTDSQDYSQFIRRSSTYSQVSNDTQNSDPYFRLVTNDSYKLDQEAQFSRHASQYSVPEHSMDQEARFSRRSSQFTVSQTQDVKCVESFLRAMEISQRSQKVLMNHQFSRFAEENKRSEAMRESEESRSLLVRLSRRSVVKIMTGGMNSTGVTGSKLNFIGCYKPNSKLGKQSNADRVAADLRRMEAMILAEQEHQLGNISPNLRCHDGTNF